MKFISTRRTPSSDRSSANRPPVVSPAELPEPALPRSPALDMIERAIVGLLPHAARDVMLPFETPLRWHESRMEREDQPFSFELWVNLNRDRTRHFELDRRLPLDRSSVRWLWKLSMTEPAPATDPKADTAVTYATIDRAGKVELGTARYRVFDAEHRTYVGGESDSELSAERRAEILAHMQAVVTEAITETPDAQAAFCAELGIDRPSRSFDALASRTTRLALGPILAVPVENLASMPS